MLSFVGVDRDRPGGQGGVSSRAVLALASALLVSACLGADPSDADAAGEAVVRHLVGRNFDAHANAPWDVVCLSRRDGFGEEPADAFLRRFEGGSPPVVSGERCAADPSGDSRWVVEGTGEVGLEIWLEDARARGSGELLVMAGASGGPIDFSLYECVVVRGETGWEVDGCRATVMT